jgi:hypothetical protein
MYQNLQAPYWKRGAKDDGKGPEMAMLKNKAMSLAKDLEVSSSCLGFDVQLPRLILIHSHPLITRIITV